MSFRDKRVVVTGGAGFLGSFVVEALRARGCSEIFVPRSSQYDLVDIEGVRSLYRDAKPDLVLHLAAKVGGIGANRDNPGKFFYDNLMMGTQLIEEGRKVGVKKIVAVGTICAYPKFATIPFREDDMWSGYPEETNAPYGLAKKMLLVQSEAYRQQYGMNTVVLFPVNLYGPRDNFDLQTSHVIPAMIHKLDSARRAGAKKVTLWGDGTPTREFLYVEDCAAGILDAAERYDSSDPVNLGSGHEISIRDLAHEVRSVMKLEQVELEWDATKPNGQPRRALDVSRAKERFGWTAKMPFPEGLRRTIQWWEQNR